MKKYLLAFVILISLSFSFASCTVESDSSLPTEVNKLRDANQFDTVLVIKTEAKTYQFDYKTKALITSNSNGSDSSFGMFLFWLFIIILLFVIFL